MYCIEIGITSPITIGLKETGPQGIQGETGDQGIQGIQGIQGEKGDTGDQGIQGIQGEKGDTGDQGIQGIQGETGATGDQGIQGIQGETGETGDQGIQGIQGIQGVTGATGPQGIQGPSGDNTKYASEIVTAPTSGILTLKLATESYIGTLTNANAFTVALPTPTAGYVAESILIFKIGATLPTITQPSGIAWRGLIPTLVISTSWTIAYESINTSGSTYEIWATACKNG